MYNQGPYLRVLTPRTTNGTNLKIGPDGRVDYKEAHLPMSAKWQIEQYNAKLPQHLRKVIEVVQGDTKDAQKTEIERLLEELAKEKERSAELAKRLATGMDQNLQQSKKLDTDQPANPNKPTIKPQPIKQ